MCRLKSGADASPCVRHPSTAAETSGVPPSDTTNAGLDETTAGVKYDVGGIGDGTCKSAPAGITCHENTAIECDGNGAIVSEASCLPDICVAGKGCVECLAGQFHCSGPRVMTCDTSVDPPHWVELEVCDPTAGEGCNQELGTCEVLMPLGTSEPTGTYYMYANFPILTTEGTIVGNVGSHGDLVYATAHNTSDVLVYKITLLDSDNDGELEPNQHPDNPDAPGPIEERTIARIEVIPNIKNFDVAYDFGLVASEIYPAEDRIFVGGAELTEYAFGGGGGTVITTAPTWTWNEASDVLGPNEKSLGIFSHIGYDDIGGVWYASSEGDRRVLQYDAETDSWGIAFRYPALTDAGWHMDGMEVVTDPNTGTSYVYVSDMGSDFIAQYRLDDELGWVQQNVFAYNDGQGEFVEGMGFGALNHFWFASNSNIYEIGGGDLVNYTEPKPEG